MNSRRAFSTTCRCLDSHYDTLGVSPRASRKEIKAAFHKLSMRFHPDRKGTEASESKFADISNAYNTLSDERARRSYDSTLTPNVSPFSAYTAPTQPRTTATHAWQHYRRHSPHSHYQSRHSNASHDRSRPASEEYEQFKSHFERMQRRYDKASNLWGTQSRMQARQRAEREERAKHNTPTSTRLGQILLVVLGITVAGHKMVAHAEEVDHGQVRLHE